MAKNKPDPAFKAAKKKLAAAIDKCPDNDVEKLTQLCNTLAKMKMVELKATDGGGWGEDLDDDPGGDDDAD